MAIIDFMILGFVIWSGIADTDWYKNRQAMKKLQREWAKEHKQ